MCFKKVDKDKTRDLTEYLLIITAADGEQYCQVSHHDRSKKWQNVPDYCTIEEVYCLDTKKQKAYIEEENFKEKILSDWPDIPNEADKYIDWDPDWYWLKTKKNKQIRTRLTDRTRPYPIGYPFSYDWDLWEE